MWVCQLLPPPFLGLPTLLEHKSDLSKNNFFHRISYKKNGKCNEQLSFLVLSVKSRLTKGLRTFLAKALAGLFISIWSIVVFLQDQRHRLVSEGKQRRQETLWLWTFSVISLPTLSSSFIIRTQIQSHDHLKCFSHLPDQRWVAM